ncbi:hypothetical protein C0992_000621 [Termitomyces sp. T32_za158]|nr:hypothetical protein C0992_000621 [Termitomyces sp. T32_za158]
MFVPLIVNVFDIAYPHLTAPCFLTQSFDDDVLSIYSSANLQALSLLTRTQLQDSVYAYVCNRICGNLNNYGLPANHLFPLLASTNSVISGSFVLSLLLPEREFIPTDLDIYVPNEYRAVVINTFVQTHGYFVDPDPVSNGYIENDAVDTIVRLRRENRIIDVVVAKGANALGPITQFHSTPVMNFMSATEIVCAYPELTLRHCGLINRGRVRAQATNEYLVAALSKYRRRGFDLVVDVRQWDDYRQHECGQCAYCPATVRRFSDSFTFVFPISDIIKSLQRGVHGCLDTNTSWLLTDTS